MDFWTGCVVAAMVATSVVLCFWCLADDLRQARLSAARYRGMWDKAVLANGELRHENDVLRERVAALSSLQDVLAGRPDAGKHRSMRG